MSISDGFIKGFGLVDKYERDNFQESRQREHDKQRAEIHGLTVQDLQNSLDLYPMEVRTMQQGIEKRDFGLDTQQEVHDTTMYNTDSRSRVNNANAYTAELKHPYVQQRELLDVKGKVIANTGGVLDNNKKGIDNFFSPRVYESGLDKEGAETAQTKKNTYWIDALNHADIFNTNASTAEIRLGNEATEIENKFLSDKLTQEQTARGIGIRYNSGRVEKQDFEIKNQKQVFDREMAVIDGQLLTQKLNNSMLKFKDDKKAEVYTRTNKGILLDHTGQQLSNEAAANINSMFSLQQLAAQLGVNKQVLENQNLQIQVDNAGEVIGLQIAKSKVDIAMEKANLGAKNYENAAKNSVSLANQLSAQSGEITEDQYEMILNSAKNPGSVFYTMGPELDAGFRQNAALEKLFNGEVSFGEVAQDIRAFTKDSVESIIGQTDEQGRTIVAATMVGFDTSDNDPNNVPGGYPIIAVKYRDGTERTGYADTFRTADDLGDPKFVSVDSIIKKHMAQRSMLSMFAATGFDKKVKAAANNAANRNKKLTDTDKASMNAFVEMLDTHYSFLNGKQGELGQGWQVPPPGAAAASWRRLDRAAEQNMPLAIELGYKPPPTKEEILYQSDNRDFTGIDKDQFLNAVLTGKLSRRDAISLLAKETVQKKRAVVSTNPTEAGGDDDLNSKLSAVMGETGAKPKPKPKSNPVTEKTGGNGMGLIDRSDDEIGRAHV